ncbi:MAG: type VI secretion system-associated FHA domain protein TagH [Pseudomonadota bacterium]|nr:type VI secretion system-associated FHA domain protein TagH [Pseudomonadota bacterium]
MDLVLTVVGCPSHANMLNHTKVFKEKGGVIGRSDSNDWVLPDAERIVSSRHVEVQFSAGKFFIVDHSTNGTFINDSQSPLGNGNSHELVSGDILNCGEYQLKASLKAPPAEAPPAAGLGSVDFLDGDKTTFNHATAARQQAASEAKELDSWLDPQAPRAPVFDDDWGTASQNERHEEHISDPWAASQGPASSVIRGAENLDPLAAFDRTPQASSFSTPAAQTPGWDDDDWWKSGSVADHAPADQHQMRVTEQKPFVPPEPAPATPPPPAQDNPFAASQAGRPEGNDDIDSLFGLASTPPPEVRREVPQTPPPAAADPAPQVAASDDFFRQSAWNETPRAEMPPLSAPESPAADAVKPQAGGAHFGADELQQLATLLGVDDIRSEQLRSLLPEMSSMINETVTRLIDLLRARTAIKNELRVQHTMIQTVDNNPLKFSASAADALKVMFAGDRSAFMRPSQAIQDSFDDLSDHQVAVLKGMNAAYEAMLRHFDPENLKRYINAKDSLLGNREAKQWVAFEQYYDTLKRDYETTYNKLFGEEFARHYERQLSELKNTRALNQGQ